MYCPLIVSVFEEMPKRNVVFGTFWFLGSDFCIFSGLWVCRLWLGSFLTFEAGKVGGIVALSLANRCIILSLSGHNIESCWLTFLVQQECWMNQRVEEEVHIVPVVIALLISCIYHVIDMGFAFGHQKRLLLKYLRVIALMGTFEDFRGVMEIRDALLKSHWKKARQREFGAFQMSFLRSGMTKKVSKILQSLRRL